MQIQKTRKIFVCFTIVLLKMFYSLSVCIDLAIYIYVGFFFFVSLEEYRLQFNLLCYDRESTEEVETFQWFSISHSHCLEYHLNVAVSLC